MDEILEAFSEESKTIIIQMIEVLEKVDEDPGRFRELNEFSRLVDGIMGSAQSLAVDYPPDHAVQKIASFAELCKVIGQKGTKVENAEKIAPILTAFLLDASEALQGLNSDLVTGQKSDMAGVLDATFLKRLRTLAEVFDKNRKDKDVVSQESAKSAQDDIDSILKQLGG